MTKQEQHTIARKLNATLGVGTLNWMGDYNYEFKKPQFSVFFHKENEAKKAIKELSKYGETSIHKTPKFINVYFKFSVNVKY